MIHIIQVFPYLISVKVPGVPSIHLPSTRLPMLCSCLELVPLYVLRFIEPQVPIVISLREHFIPVHHICIIYVFYPSFDIFFLLLLPGQAIGPDTFSTHIIDHKQQTLSWPTLLGQHFSCIHS